MAQISDLVVATAVNGTDEFLVRQGGEDKRVSKNTINTSFVHDDLVGSNHDTLYPRNVESLKDLASITPVDGQTLTTRGLFSGNNYGGYTYIYSVSIPKTSHDGIDIITPESISAWDGSVENISQLTGWTGTGLGGYIRKPEISSEVENQDTVFLEQFVTGFGGRGMLTSETPSITTERVITTDAVKGADLIVVSTTADIIAGGRVTIYHSVENIYETYFVADVSAGSIGIKGGLLYQVKGGSCRVERTWYNQAHAGKFYMRQLAQRVARGVTDKVLVPCEGRLFFSQFESNPTNSNDLLTGINGATIAYVDELNVSQGDITKPLESMIGRAAFIAISANGQGAETKLIPSTGSEVITHITLMCRDENVDVAIQVVDISGLVHFEKELDNCATMKRVSFQVKLPATSNSIKVRVVAKSGVTSSTSLIVDEIDLFEHRVLNIGSSRFVGKTLVGLGDSWIAGDISQSERESIMTHLQKELPLTKVINKGVGGNTINLMYDRFETDVAPFNPDYVIVCTGTNDAYSPISATFMPNAVDQFMRYFNLLINKIKGIGAIPIIIGVPALAQSDAAVPALPEWELNYRARTYSRMFYSKYATTPSTTTTQKQTFTPDLQINGSSAGITYSNRVGHYYVNNGVVDFYAEINLSSKGSSVGFVTLPLPVASSSNSIMNVISVNMVSATGCYFATGIASNTFARLQIDASTGTTAADNTNLTNTSVFYVSGSYYL